MKMLPSGSRTGAFPSLQDRPVAESARHVTADTATYQDYPEQGDSHGWQGMNEQAEGEMNKREQSLAPVRPTAVMAPLKG